MGISGFRPLQVLSDGRKLFLIYEEGKGRQCFEFCDSSLVNSEIQINTPRYEVSNFGDLYKEFVAGPTSVCVKLEFQSGIFSLREQPIVMGVDIFNKLSVLDYISVINEKIKQR